MQGPGQAVFVNLADARLQAAPTAEVKILSTDKHLPPGKQSTDITASDKP